MVSKVPAEADIALLRSEERFRALVVAGSYAVYRMSADWDQMFLLEGREFLADTTVPSGDWMESYILEEDRPAVADAIARAVRHASTFEFEHRVRRADGGIGWTLSRAVPILNDDGSIREWFGLASDVTARRTAEEALRRSEERLTLLVAELQHRTRNLLAVVSGVADQTRATAPTLEAFGEAFGHRLAALGRAQGLLSAAPMPAVQLGELVRMELAAHGAATHAAGTTPGPIEGPPVWLPPATVQMLALALHELATNAVKHGALGHAGRLKVRWRVDDGPGDPPVLRIDWREEGVRVADESRRRRGFGSALIEVELPYEIDAVTSLTFGPDTVHCCITLPLE